jgi:PAS domain S-box-containing protein
MNDLTDNAPSADSTADENIKALEVHYRGLFKAAQDGILLLDAETRKITDANPFLCELLGYSRAEMLGKELWEIGLFRDQEQSRAAFRDLQRRGFIRYEDLPLESKGGERREVEVIGHAYEENDHRVIVCIIRDITERKRIQKDKYFLSAVVESLEDSVVTVDFETIITSWNKSAERLYGYAAADVIGKPLMILTLPADLNEVLANIEQVKRGETVKVYETERIHKDGSPLFLTITLSPVKDARGLIIGVSTVARNISSFKRAEEALQRSEETFRMLVEGVTDYAIFTLDRAGLIATWNPGAQRIFGYAEAEAIGQPAALIFTPEDRQSGIPEEEMRQARETGRAIDERWHLRKDGSRFYASGVMSPLGDVALTGYVKVARDLTERKLMEEELTRARTQLEERVEERTGELRAAITLLQSEITRRREIEEERRRLLERNVRVQEEERRRISRELHDSVGQQLTVLRLAIQSMTGQMDQDIENLKEIVKKIDAEVDFLAWELRPASLDDFGLITALQAFVAGWERHFKIPAVFQVVGLAEERIAPELEINLYRIAQEALNNIVKHARAAHINVVLQKVDETLVMIIEDDGVGFETDKGAIPKATERGFGLIGMRERAALMGGSVEIESTPGSGTTIYVHVPFSEASETGVRLERE